MVSRANALAGECPQRNVVATRIVVRKRGDANGRIVMPSGVIAERSGTDTGVVPAHVISERTSANSGIEAAVEAVVNSKECAVTDGRVKLTADIVKKSIRPDCGVAVSADMAEKCERAIGCIFAAHVVMDHGGRSNSGVAGAGGVQQKRCNAHSSIEVAIVKTKRYSANTRIPTTGRI